ncbi:MAG: hypothetical protein NTV49_11955 [Kiritimatiellaeota bacterium]|nr:hypothetical protein [Kiritimatiellota bacterium]
MKTGTKPSKGRTGALLGRALALAACCAWAGRSADGKTANGNELALQHFFRYLRILSLQEGESNGYPHVSLSLCEPSSQMTVKCKVMKSLSLAKLKEDPPVKVGEAVALTGVVAGVNPAEKAITLNPVIVRHRDRLAPKPGKELLYEVDSSAVVYSFTGGKNPVNVTKRDEDLLQQEGAILASQGKDGWARFLLQEIAKRDQAALAKRNQLNIFRREAAPPTADELPPGAATNPPPPITEGEDD